MTLIQILRINWVYSLTSCGLENGFTHDLKVKIFSQAKTDYNIMIKLTRSQGRTKLLSNNCLWVTYYLKNLYSFNYKDLYIKSTVMNFKTFYSDHSDGTLMIQNLHK